MGEWAKADFGVSKFNSIGIMLAGTANPEFEKKILGLFDKKLSSKDCVYHCHLAKKKNKLYPVVSNVYGAPAAVDALALIHDGGCRNLIFIGYAYGGFKNLEVGSIVIPTKAYHYDGIYHAMKLDRNYATPDKLLKNKIEEIFKTNNIKHVEGIDISVPAVTLQLKHANPEYKKIKPTTVEMELAACLSRAKQIGIRAVGILIISDNRNSSIGDEYKKKRRYEAKLKVIKTIVNNLESLDLDKLKLKEFNINEYLASIIEDSKDKNNIYKIKKK
ncbi:MAG TPA: hypothetical protein VJI68_01645 [Candidatus Nanoarchaeia archaeon]|nr:hypothetical protein [Candidatus Nanoarchaeia archaeon]